MDRSVNCKMTSKSSGCDLRLVSLDAILSVTKVKKALKSFCNLYWFLNLVNPEKFPMMKKKEVEIFLKLNARKCIDFFVSKYLLTLNFMHVMSNF